MPSSVVTLLHHRDREAQSIFFWVVAQRRLLNISIERSIMTYMDQFGMTARHYDRLRADYFRIAKELKESGMDLDPCNECPKLTA